GSTSRKGRCARVCGCFLEVTRSKLHLVPAHWERRQTTVGAERFVTPELKDWEARVLGADEKRIALERALFEELREAVLERAGALRHAAAALARVDALLSFTRVA